MEEIVKGLYVGGVSDAREIARKYLLDEPGRVALIDVRKFFKGKLGGWGWKSEVTVPKLITMSLYIHECIKNGVPVLVFCEQGRHRAPLVVAFYLVYTGQARTFEYAYNMIRAHRDVSVETTALPAWARDPDNLPLPDIGQGRSGFGFGIPFLRFCDPPPGGFPRGSCPRHSVTMRHRDTVKTSAGAVDFRTPTPRPRLEHRT